MQTGKLFKCFDWRFMGIVMLCAVLIMAAAWLGRDLSRGAPARIGLALAQGALFAAVIVLTLRAIRRLDELGQRIHHEAIVFAFAGSGISVTAWGFLEKAGLPAVRWGVWIWPFMVTLWMAGLAIVSRRYR